jgi:uncharacterized RDD family membrane protein YckC
MSGAPGVEPSWGTGVEPAWKMELQQKLAARRARRGGREEDQSSANEGMRPQHGAGGARASLAAAVAARYSSLPSYREALAQQAHAAAQAAEDAALHAHAAAEAVLAQIEESRAMERAERAARDAEARAIMQAAEQPAVKLTLDARTQQQFDQHRAALEARQSARDAASGQPVFTPATPRLTDPIEEVLVTPSVPLAANLIEFPRELVALRKARPRLAEGPLRETFSERDEAGSQDASQLRIYEVHPGEVHSGEVQPGDVRPGDAQSGDAQSGEGRSGRMQSERASARAHAQSRSRPMQSGASEWSAIRLDSGQPGREQPHPPAKTLALPLKTASIQDRLMSALVDFALVSVGFLLFVLVFCACTAHPPTGKAAFAGSAAVLLGLFIVYQLLFFSFGEATPGMSYAHIALCTFEDNNPTRKAMRRRVGALLLSALPVGLGLLWAVFDEDRLGWHDRISGTYQRSYR